MIRKRLIPRILVKEVNDSHVAVISKHFGSFNTVGDPASQFGIMEANMADEISIINVGNHQSLSRRNFFDLLKAIVRASSTPIVAGGGIKTFLDVDNFMKIGIEKVAIPLRIDLANVEIVNYACKKFGKQSVQVCLDYKELDDAYLMNKSEKRLELNDLLRITSTYCTNGAGELVLTDMSRDGSKSGLNLNILKPFIEVFSIPIIVSGGAHNQNNFAEAFLMGADGVISGTYFAKKDHSLIQLRSSIVGSGISLRKLG